MSRDKVFLLILAGLLGFMLLVGLGAVVLSIAHNPSDQVAIKVIGGIGSMFASVVALVLGYMVGRNGRQNGAS